jgi:hypothetical protein
MSTDVERTFTHAERIEALEVWLRAAEAIRSTCQNLEVFDLLISHQRARLSALTTPESSDQSRPE